MAKTSGASPYVPMSAYGAAQDNSMGYDPRNPYAQRATQAVKPYTPKATGAPKFTLKPKDKQ